jgi:putative phosphoribosyl transferase
MLQNVKGRYHVFKDRKDAGKQLAEALNAYKGREPLVLAIPRGGVAVGYQVARHLHGDFSIVVVRKLPFPENPESGFGAIAENGIVYFVDRALQILSSDTVERIVKEQKREISRCIEVLREGKPLPVMRNRTVILVDDGIAMGSSMRAAILLCQSHSPAKIVVAAPVAGPSTAAELEEFVDEVIILEKPSFFRAVAQAYERWYDVSDEEVIRIMRKYEQLKQRAFS